MHTQPTSIALSLFISFPLAANMALILAAAIAAVPVGVASMGVVSDSVTSHFERLLFLGNSIVSLMEENLKKHLLSVDKSLQT